MKRTDFTRSRVKEFSEVRDDDRPHLSRKSDAVTFSTRSGAGLYSPAPQAVKKASQSSRPQARINSNPFSAAACTSRKTHFGLKVCELSATGGRRVRAAGRILLKKVTQSLF